MAETRDKADLGTSIDLSEKSTNVDFDEILPQVGEYGRYQILLIWLICLPSCIPCGFQSFNQLFMTNTPDHWCRIPDLINNNISVEDRKKIGIPFSQEKHESCTMYDINYINVVKEYGTNFSDFEPNPIWPVIPCAHGWEYDTSHVPSSVVMAFDLVCDKNIYTTLGLSALNIGGIIGVFMFGMISDKFGRRISFFTCLAVELTGGLASAMAPNFYVWCACRFMVGLSIPAIYQIPFIIALELVGPTYRGFVTVMTCLFYTFGLLMLCVVAYFVKNWVEFTLVTTAPFLLFFIYMFFLPESPRWLLSRNRLEEAYIVLEKMAIVNGKTPPENLKNKLKERMLRQNSMSIHSVDLKIPGLLDLFKTPNMRKKTLLISFNWLANECVYVGLSYYGPAMGSDELVSFFLSCLVEIPSYLVCWLIMDLWGRRWPLAICMIMGGTSAVATALLPSSEVTWILVLFLIAKFSISASFLIIYPFAGELYPTNIRGKGIGFSGYIGGLGLIVIPFINYLGKEFLVLPLVVMGCLSIIGGLSGLCLPETLNQKLPQSIEEGEEFGKDWTLKDCFTCVPKSELRHRASNLFVVRLVKKITKTWK